MATPRARWPAYNFPPPNGGLLVYTIMPDGNPACASYDGGGCLWGLTYDQIDFNRLKPLACGEQRARGRVLPATKISSTGAIWPEDCALIGDKAKVGTLNSCNIVIARLSFEALRGCMSSRMSRQLVFILIRLPSFAHARQQRID